MPHMTKTKDGKSMPIKPRKKVALPAAERGKSSRAKTGTTKRKSNGQLHEWPDGTGQLKVGRTVVSLLKGEEDLDEWTDEELMRGARMVVRSTPNVIPLAVYQEFIKRVQSRVRHRFAAELEYAVRVHMDIVKNWQEQMDQFGESAIPAAVCLKAIDMIYDRVLGKPDENVVLYNGGDAKWRAIAANAIVASEDQIEEFEKRAALEVDNEIVEGEVVDEDE